MGPRFSRRAALVSVLAVSGCGLEPIRFVEESQTQAPPSEEPARVVDPQFFERAQEGGVKTLPEGTLADVRIATPHVNCVLRGHFVGRRLSAATVLQLGQQQDIEAPEGHELVCFILQGEVPVYDRTVDRRENTTLQVGGQPIELGDLFDTYIRGEGWLREWEMIALSVLEGAEVILAVEDQDRRVSLDLRTGQPVEDEGWLANRGFRERLRITCEPQTGIYQRQYQTQPGAEYQSDQGQLFLQLQPDVSLGLLPWIPSHGWAPDAQQWLLAPMISRAGFDNVMPQMDIDVGTSFQYHDPSGGQVEAISPETTTFELLLRNQGQLDPVWPVSGNDETGTIVVDLQGQLTVDYTEMTGVPAAFTGDHSPLEFALRFTPV